MSDAQPEKISPRVNRHVVSIDIDTAANNAREKETKDGEEEQQPQAPVATVSQSFA